METSAQKTCQMSFLTFSNYQNEVTFWMILMTRWKITCTIVRYHHSLHWIQLKKCLSRKIKGRFSVTNKNYYLKLFSVAITCNLSMWKISMKWSEESWRTSEFRWYIIYGPKSMVHVIWISYGPYHMGHIWTISYGSYEIM